MATGHAGFTAGWRVVGDGIRLVVIAMGRSQDGPLFLCWHRAPGSVQSVIGQPVA